MIPWIVMGLSLIFMIFIVYSLNRIKYLLGKNRIIHSMTLRTIIEYIESKGVEVDLHDIKKKVERQIELEDE